MISRYFDRIESALQRVPYDINWIANEGEPAMEALNHLRAEFAEIEKSLTEEHALRMRLLNAK